MTYSKTTTSNKYSKHDWHIFREGFHPPSLWIWHTIRQTWLLCLYSPTLLMDMTYRRTNITPMATHPPITNRQVGHQLISLKKCFWQPLKAKLTQVINHSHSQKPQDADEGKIHDSSVCYVLYSNCKYFSLTSCLWFQWQVFAWVAVFVLPLNAAINPVLYTLSTTPFLSQGRHGLLRFRHSCRLSRQNYSSSLPNRAYGKCILLICFAQV